MLNIAYLNPFSIFDYTSGSSKSMSLLLNSFNEIGCNVSCFCSCISYSEAGYLNSVEIFNKNNNGSKTSKFIF